MKIHDTGITQDPENFEYYLNLEVKIPVEIIRELNGLFVLDMKDELAKIIGIELVDYISQVKISEVDQPKC
jgi:hypothetical protein